MLSNQNNEPMYKNAPWSFNRAQAQGAALITPWWGMGDAVIAFIGAGVVSVITSVILVSSNIDPLHGWGLVISTSSPWLMLLGWPLFAAAKKGNGPRIDLGLLGTKTQLKVGLIGGILAITLGGIIGVIQQQFTGPITSVAGDLALNQQGIVLIIFLLMIMFGAPIVEEIAFRGLLFGALVKAQFSGIASVVLSSGIFSLFHFELNRILILFVIGLVLGEVRRRTGSTLAAIAAHFAVNTPAALAILFTSLGIGPALN